MELTVKRGTLSEAMALLAVLREFVAMEVSAGEGADWFLFAKGMFIGPPAQVEKLRAALDQRATVDVRLVSNDTLQGLFGRPLSVIAMLLDPDGKLGS
jgi:hypothetical protein